jgi:hypothetical protein
MPRLSSVACSPPAPAGGHVVCSRLLTAATHEPIELIDITHAVEPAEERPRLLVGNRGSAPRLVALG